MARISRRSHSPNSTDRLCSTIGRAPMSGVCKKPRSQERAPRWGMAWLCLIRVGWIMPRMTIQRSRISCRRGVLHFRIKDQLSKMQSQANLFKMLITLVKWAVKQSLSSILARASLDRAVASSQTTQEQWLISYRKKWPRDMRALGAGDKLSPHSSLVITQLRLDPRNITFRILSMLTSGCS